MATLRTYIFSLYLCAFDRYSFHANFFIEYCRNVRAYFSNRAHFCQLLYGKKNFDSKLKVRIVYQKFQKR